ncbi:MAG TPA: transposase [Terriglobales bacterium]|nr:transposase [Terriglobales bacterium]
MAWEVVRTVLASVGGRPDAVPGMIGAIQTFGDLIHWHPHIHALVTEGVFLNDGTFLPLPKLATEPFLKLWEQAVFDLLLSEGKITNEVVENIRSWSHSGFSVDQSVRIEAEDTEGVQKLIEYFLRCPFSQARMIEVTAEGKVLYKTERNRLGRFPEAASEDLLAGPKRNFQVFDPLDFLAEVTQHIPDAGDHLIRYYGWYSNKSRGLRAKSGGAAAPPTEVNGPDAKQARQRWAALIKQVYELDPLLCPKCGGTMAIISFIERGQGEVIEKILRHCGLWEEEAARAPPGEQARGGCEYTRTRWGGPAAPRASRRAPAGALALSGRGQNSACLAG